MNHIHIQFYQTQYAQFILGSYQQQLCLLDFRHRKMRQSVDNRIKKGLNAEFIEKSDELLEQTKMQLDEYLFGERTEFTLPLLMVGSEFQQSVWRALLQVPYGETATYQQLAKNIGNEKAVRAVANANGANAIAIIIPCHRIIGSNGELVGYGGGTQLKLKLLTLEQNLFAM